MFVIPVIKEVCGIGFKTPLQDQYKNLNNKKIAAWNFPRKGATIVNSLTLRLCVRIFPGLAIHAVSQISRIGGVQREVSFSKSAASNKP